MAQQNSAEQAFLAQHGQNVPDLAHLASNRTSAQSVPTNPMTGHEPGQLTPTEVNQCEAAAMRLNNHWMRKTYDPDSPDRVWDQFAQEARNVFGEIGFLIDISWSEVQADGLPGTAAVPQITIIGRVDKRTETDHDLVQREVREGLHDGRKGVMRGDGTWSEDARKKQL